MMGIPFALLGMVCLTLVPNRLANAQESACPAITENVARRVIQAVRSKYRLPDEVTFTIKSQTELGGTCHRKLDLTAAAPNNGYNVSVYLSPENRFLAVGLIDLEDDTTWDEHAQSKRIAAQLEKGRHPTEGSGTAEKVVVIFADFQCPYCKRFMEETRAKVRSGSWPDVKLVFQNLPLAIHPWAKDAAKAAMCANLQSNAAFWQMHDLIFARQENIKREAAKELFLSYAKEIAGLNADTYRMCLEDDLSLGLVERDVALAALLGVGGTPTAFVNGKRVELPGSIDAVNQAIRALEKRPVATDQ